MEYTWHYESPLGNMMMAGDGESLTGLWFDGQKHFANTLGLDYEEKRVPVFDETINWLDLYFSGEVPDFTPPLYVKGTNFQKRVCSILLEIPYGQTRTYGSIARQIAEERGKQKMSAQAVGGAVGYNPILLIIPCHRVVGTNGSLTGYGGGIWRKVKLLELEKTDMTGLFVPKQNNKPY